MKMDITALLISLAIAAVVVYALTLLLPSKKNNAAPLPPGPKPLPLVGNIKDIPPAGVREWEFWTKHKDLYDLTEGPISSITVLGTTMIIINDSRIAFELMEKRGNLHSSRPKMVFGMEMCGWEHALASQPYSDRFRAYRKQIYQGLGSKQALSNFTTLQDTEVRRFLLRTLKTPDDLTKHIHTEAGAIILKIAYGYTIEPHREDPLVDLGDRALQQFAAAAVPGAWLVDMIPALKYLPDWFPGAGFKRTARLWKATFMELGERPMRFVKQEMAEKHNAPSYLSNIYEKAGKRMSDEEEYIAKWAAASMYAGGADTSVAVMEIFFLAMTLHPEVQKKAREEIDRVVGRDRLPTVADKEKLPYINAVFQESMRWHSLAPMGLPHTSTEDDMCEGYLIPKEALLIANVWWFTHDPDVYADPSKFDPERWLVASPPPSPTEYIFGFGRRRCPGSLLAEQSVWLTIAKSLAVFDIGKGVENGKVIEPSVEFIPGIISRPVPFKATIKPRSSKYEDLIRAVEVDHPWEQSSAGKLQSITVQTV